MFFSRSAKLFAAIALVSALSLVTGVSIGQNAAATPLFQSLQTRQGTATNGSIQPVQIPLSQPLPKIKANVVFQTISSGGFAGLTYETLLLKNGQLIRSRINRDGSKSEIIAIRLSPQRVRRFEKLVKTHIKPFDRLSYPAHPGSADFFMVTASSHAGTVQYADIIQSELPSSLKIILQAWNQLAAKQ